MAATEVASALVSDDRSNTVSIFMGVRVGTTERKPKAPSKAISLPTRTTTVAPGITPPSTASLKARSTSGHPTTDPLPPLALSHERDSNPVARHPLTVD